MGKVNFGNLCIIAALIGVSVFSCKKNKTTPTPIKNTPIPIGMTAIVNNANWVATSYDAYLDTVDDTVIFLYINGDNANSLYPNQDFFTIIIKDYKFESGVFNINNAISPNSVNYTYNYNQYKSISGTIALTQVSPTNIQGTFNGTFSSGSNLTVTNGQFNVPIQ